MYCESMRPFRVWGKLVLTVIFYFKFRGLCFRLIVLGRRAALRVVFEHGLIVNCIWIPLFLYVANYYDSPKIWQFLSLLLCF